jgi:hypothetical protein
MIGYGTLVIPSRGQVLPVPPDLTTSTVFKEFPLRQKMFKCKTQQKTENLLEQLYLNSDEKR